MELLRCFANKLVHLLTKNTFPKQTRTEETLRDYLPSSNSSFGGSKNSTIFPLISARAREVINAGSALPASEKRTSRKKQKEVAFDDLLKLVHELRRPLNVKTREAIRRMAEWANNFPSRDAFETAIATLAKLLTRSCTNAFPKGRVKICFYTLRHQMIANTKQTFDKIVGGDEALNASPA